MTCRKAPLVIAAFLERRAAHGAGLTSDGTVLSLYANAIARWGSWCSPFPPNGISRTTGLWVRVSGIESPCLNPAPWRGKSAVGLAMAAGDFRNNPTTLAKLNLIPGVLIVCQGRTRRTGVGGELSLNGKPWDGTWALAFERPNVRF